MSNLGIIRCCTTSGTGGSSSVSVTINVEDLKTDTGEDLLESITNMQSTLDSMTISMEDDFAPNFTRVDGSAVDSSGNVYDTIEFVLDKDPRFNNVYAYETVDASGAVSSRASVGLR